MYFEASAKLVRLKKSANIAVAGIVVLWLFNFYTQSVQGADLSV